MDDGSIRICTASARRTRNGLSHFLHTAPWSTRLGRTRRISPQLRQGTRKWPGMRNLQAQCLHRASCPSSSRRARPSCPQPGQTKATFLLGPARLLSPVVPAEVLRSSLPMPLASHRPVLAVLRDVRPLSCKNTQYRAVRWPLRRHHLPTMPIRNKALPHDRAGVQIPQAISPDRARDLPREKRPDGWTVSSAFNWRLAERSSFRFRVDGLPNRRKGRG